MGVLCADSPVLVRRLMTTPSRLFSDDLFFPPPPLPPPELRRMIRFSPVTVAGGGFSRLTLGGAAVGPPGGATRAETAEGFGRLPDGAAPSSSQSLQGARDKLEAQHEEYRCKRHEVRT